MKIESTWGDGPDVTMSLCGTKMVCLEEPTPNGFVHGGISKGCLDLTCIEARALAVELNKAAEVSEELHRTCAEHDSK